MALEYLVIKMMLSTFLMMLSSWAWISTDSWKKWGLKILSWFHDHNVTIEKERKLGCTWDNVVLVEGKSQSGWLDV